MKRVLLVEDDAAFAEILSDNLRHEGFDVRWVADGNAAADAVKALAPDVVLLDINLPGRSGFELCAAWRTDHRFPVIMLTVNDQRADRVRGLNLGADDYVIKPFHFQELVARINAVLRRTRQDIERVTLGPVTIDFLHRRAFMNGRPIALTRREFDLLKYLAERCNHIVYRDELLKEVWGFPEAPVTRAVDKAVARLRQKIELDPHNPQFIHTAHGDGYWLNL